MNEIKRIHLGRQPFTISVEAHRALRDYLQEIERQVGADSEVIKEVEMRMAELLGERGISGEKVVLTEDVDFLKEQLGEPRDFKDEDAKEDEEGSQKTAEDTAEKAENASASGPRQLYRDPEHGMIAGVAAGLATYLNIDVLIVRILFVVLAFASGAGIVLYILLWILAPEAKTSSDRLKMRGKAVTVDSIKAAVDRADFPGAAQRAGTSISRGVAPVFMGILKAFLIFFGLIFVVAGTAIIFGGLTTGLGVLTHQIYVGLDVIFPVTVRDRWAVGAAMLVATLIGLFFILIGIATIRRKWKVPGWVVATLAGLFLAAAAATTALGLDSTAQVRSRIEDARHTQTQAPGAFTKVKLSGNDLVAFKYSDTYSIEYSYLGKRDESGIKFDVKDGLLSFDARDFHKSVACGQWCVYGYDDAPLEVTIYAPSIDDLELQHFSACEADDPVVRLNRMPAQLKLDGATFTSVDELHASQNADYMTMSNCVDFSRP